MEIAKFGYLAPCKAGAGLVQGEKAKVGGEIQQLMSGETQSKPEENVLATGIWSLPNRCGRAASKRIVRLSSEQRLLLMLLILAFLIRVFYAAATNPDLDEAQFLYDAHLLGDGLIPFVDWHTRAPLLLGFLAASIEVFGYTLMAGKLVIIVFAALTSCLLYLVGKELYSRRVGLVACALYCFTPFVIHWTIITKEEPVQAFFVVLSMYMLILGLKREQSRFLFLSGLFIGAAFLVRRSSIAYLPLEPLFLLLVYRQLSVVAKKEVIILAGVLIGVLPLLYIPLMTDWRWASFEYGLGSMGLMQQSSVADKGEVASNTAALVMPLVLLGLSLAIATVRQKWAHRLAQSGPFLGGFVLAISGFLMFCFLQYDDRWNMVPLSTEAKVAFGLVFVLGLAATYSLLRGCKLPHAGARFSIQLLFYWLSSISLFYIIFMEAWFGNYFMEFIPPLCVMSAVMIVCAFDSVADVPRAFWKRPFNVPAFLLVLFLVGWVVVSGVTLGTAHQYSRSWSTGDINEVAEYISQHTGEDEEIFTAGTAFAVAANRPVALHISHHAMYMGIDDDPAPYDPFDVIPSISEIVSYLQENDVKYIVMDPRTKAMVDEHVLLSEFVYLNYECVERFDIADVYRMTVD